MGRTPWDRREPGGPGIGDSVEFKRRGELAWGLITDRLVDGTLQLKALNEDGAQYTRCIRPDQVTAWEPGRERSGVPLPNTRPWRERWDD